MCPAAQNNLAVRLRKLCVPFKPLILPNIYDAATAKIALECPTVKALATTSYAIAEQRGLSDNELTLAENITRIREISKIAATADVPLSVDLQDGYGDTAQAVREIIEAGPVGCNLEDVDNQTMELRQVGEATAKIRTAMAAARDAGVPDFVVNARTDVLGHGGNIEDAITRGKAYLNAGATTVYVWGGLGGRGLSRDEIMELTESLAGMVNVRLKLYPGYLRVDDIAALGVARISVGPDLYLSAMDAFRTALDTMFASRGF